MEYKRWTNAVIIALAIILIIVIAFPDLPFMIAPREAWRSRYFRRLFALRQKAGAPRCLYRTKCGPCAYLDGGCGGAPKFYFGCAQNGLAEGFVADANMENKPMLSFYKSYMAKDYGPDSIVVGYHYTTWCPYCKLMTPIWEKLKRNLGGGRFSGIKLIEINEEEHPTPGVVVYPTIVKYRGGKAREYHGRADYYQLREFILSPFQATTYGPTW